MRRIAIRAPRRVTPTTLSRTASPHTRILAVAVAHAHARPLSTTPATMSPPPPPASGSSSGSSNNPFSASVHAADSFQLLPESQKAGEAEDALYESQLREVEAWWSSPRYRGIKRPYSAADVVSKRGTQKISYPSSVMATKLFDLIQERAAKGEPIHTSQQPPPPLLPCFFQVVQPFGYR